MFNHLKLKKVLTAYKRDFISDHWEKEKYKWEAIQWFQNHWDNLT